MMKATNSKARKKNNFLIIFICIFLAVVIIIGSVFGIITAIKYKNAAIRYKSVTADSGTVKYLMSYYKYDFIGALKDKKIPVKDTPEFWAADAGEGKSYGELLKEGAKEYLCGIMVANDIFLEYSSYTSEDKEKVKKNAASILKNNGGSVEAFNEAAIEYGFDYDDMLAGVELIYKSKKASLAIYGVNGENLSNFPSECEKYLATYSHVSLIFVSDELTFSTDENNEKIIDSEGNYVMRPLNDEEKRERAEMKERLREAIENKKNGQEGQVSPEMFEYYIEKSDGDSNFFKSGYYFHINSAETARYATEYHPEVVEKALTMSVGDYAEVECSFGVCFIYKHEVSAGAYKDSELPFFDDFYSDAAEYLYLRILNELSSETILSEDFEEIDVLEIPYNYLFYPGG